MTRRCNLNCIGCRYHSKAIENIQSPGNQEVLDMEPILFENLCCDLAALGTKAIELTGEGEPLVNKNLFNLISIAKENNLNVTVFSNGTLLDSQHIESLFDSQLDCLKVSLWAATKQVYESNYPGTNPDYFDKIIDGLSRLASVKKARSIVKPSVIIHHLINRNNYRTLEEFVALAHKTGCDGVSFSPLKTRRGGLISVSLQPEEEKAVLSCLSSLESKANALGLKHNIKDTLRRYEVGEAVW